MSLREVPALYLLSNALVAFHIVFNSNLIMKTLGHTEK